MGSGVVDPEGWHVGRLLRSRRELTGVSYSIQHMATDGVGEATIRRVENAITPLPTQIERWLLAFHIAFDEIERRAGRPKAAREQWYYTDRDTDLWLIANSAPGNRAWWYGFTRGAGRTGAWCYVCEQLIAGFDVGRGLRSTGRYKIMMHRAEHINALLHSGAVLTKGDTV